MSETSVTRRLVAIVAADMADYSRFMHENKNATIQAWHRARNEVIDPVVARHTGRIVKHTGDGSLTEFSTVSAAVQWALAMQDDFARRDEARSDGPPGAVSHGHQSR